MSLIGKEWRAALNAAQKQDVSSGDMLDADIGTVMADVLSVLRANISKSDMSGAVKEAILSGISASITSPETGIVDIMAPKMSIFGNVGGGGAVNLAALYETGWSIGKNAWYRGLDKSGKHICFNLRTTPGFSGHAATQFAHQTAAQIMSKYPGCVVSVA